MLKMIPQLWSEICIERWIGRPAVLCLLICASDSHRMCCNHLYPSSSAPREYVIHSGSFQVMP